jgi:hypothetical protein
MGLSMDAFHEEDQRIAGHAADSHRPIDIRGVERACGLAGSTAATSEAVT